jgi:2,3-bisphosphoglycerate-dependent phosphoglycerate mutase
VTEILLVRHGETDWNRERRVQGHTDRPLNDEGRKQAQALARELAGDNVDAVYSSDLVRAHETARIVAGRLGLDVIVLPELRERDFGTWEGLTDDEILARFPQAHNGPWGDAESREEMLDRVREAIARIAAAHPNGSVLVITHGGPVRALLTACGADDVGGIPNCTLHRIGLRDGALTRLD